MIPVWDERDKRYSLSAHELTDAQVQAVREWRMNEAKTLREHNLASSWTPPPYFKFTTRPYNHKGT